MYPRMISPDVKETVKRLRNGEFAGLEILEKILQDWFNNRRALSQCERLELARAMDEMDLDGSILR